MLEIISSEKAMAEGVAEFFDHFEKRKCLKSLAAKKTMAEGVAEFLDQKRNAAKKILDAAQRREYLKSTKEGKMTTKEAIDYYGSVKRLADALGVWPQTIYTWGGRPPMGRQYELEVKTSGALRADREPASVAAEG